MRLNKLKSVSALFITHTHKHWHTQTSKLSLESDQNLKQINTQTFLLPAIFYLLIIDPFTTKTTLWLIGEPNKVWWLFTTQTTTATTTSEQRREQDDKDDGGQKSLAKHLHEGLLQILGGNHHLPATFCRAVDHLLEDQVGQSRGHSRWGDAAQQVEHSMAGAGEGDAQRLGSLPGDLIREKERKRERERERKRERKWLIRF